MILIHAQPDQSRRPLRSLRPVCCGSPTRTVSDDLSEGTVRVSCPHCGEETVLREVYETRDGSILAWACLYSEGIA